MRHFHIPCFCRLAAPAALLLCAAVASAQVTVPPRPSTAAASNLAALVIKPLPNDIVAFNTRLSAVVNPTVRGWVQSQARALSARKLAPDAMLAAARRDVLGRFSGQTLADADITTMIMLLFAICANDAQADMEALLAQMQAERAARRARQQQAAATKAELEAMKAEADSYYRELSADEMLRFQQAVDWKSQIEQMISNLMRAHTYTASTAIRNLK